MNPERKITTPEMIELKRLQKQREEDEEERERFREFRRETERREQPNREGRLKVAEWCFLNFRFFEETTRERNERIGEEPRALTELRHFLRTGGFPDIPASRRLLSIYRRIAEHCPSPFTERKNLLSGDWWNSRI